MTITTTQREAALRLADALDAYHTRSEHKEAAALLRELAAAPQGEPVAWWCKHPIEKGGGGFMTCDEAAAQHYMHKFRTFENGPVLVPLYIHPPQQRQPLTDEQVWRSDEIMECNSYIGARMNELMRLIRAIEAAHGIVEAP